MFNKELAVSGSLRTVDLGGDGEPCHWSDWGGVWTFPGATGIRREKPNLICEEEAQIEAGPRGWCRAEQERLRRVENQGEEEVLGVGEPTQTLSPQDLCQEGGVEAR